MRSTKRPTNQVVYETRCIESDSENEEIVINENDEETVEEIKIETGDCSSANIPKWQRLIGDYTLTDVNDIIDELTGLVFDHPDNEDYKQALKEAKDYQFSLSLQSRQRVKVRKDLNNKQFTTRVHIDYDRKELDEHYRVVNEAHDRSTKEKSVYRDEKPVQKNFGTKRYLPHLHMNMTNTRSGPEDWL